MGGPPGSKSRRQRAKGKTNRGPPSGEGGPPVWTQVWTQVWPTDGGDPAVAVADQPFLLDDFALLERAAQMGKVPRETLEMA